MTLSVQTIDGSFARQVSGFDTWQELSIEDVEAVRTHWREAGVLVLRRQSISEDELVAFASRFGEPEELKRAEWNSRHNPKVVVLSNLRTTKGDELGGLGAGELAWHTDQSYVANPASGAILYGVEVPADGSPTYFANLRLAYDALPDATKTRIEDAAGIYDYVVRVSGYEGAQPDVDEIRRRFPVVSHRLVYRDPISGAKSLYLDPATMAGIAGWPDDEGRALIAELLGHATRDAFVYAHHWRPGDIVMWDNGFMLHRRDHLGDRPRLMKRATLQLPSDRHVVPHGTLLDT